MSSPRTKVLSTKVTDEEYAELERAAGGHFLSTWARDALLKTARHQAAESAVLAEVLAFRTLVLTLLPILMSGEEITSGQMRDLIARVDRERFARAAARLKEAADRRAE